MKTIAFFNVKGGCGKTTSCINISYILATKYEKKVLLIDLDPQANSSDFFIDQDYDTSIEDVFVGRKNINECIQHTKYDRLDIIPSTITLFSLVPANTRLEDFVTSIFSINAVSYPSPTISNEY